LAQFLKMIGTATDRLDNDWLFGRSDLLDHVRFSRTKRPSGVSRGDFLVYYAAGWERFFGIAIVTAQSAEEIIEPGEERWPWRLGVRVPLVVPRIELAPRLSELGVANTSVRQQSHIVLTDEQYRMAFDALTGVVAPTAPPTAPWLIDDRSRPARAAPARRRAPSRL
jgi:hypothetical protein